MANSRARQNKVVNPAEDLEAYVVKDDESEEDVEPEITEEEQRENALQLRILELEAKLRVQQETPVEQQTNPVDHSGRPLPSELLNEEQKRIRDLEDKVARNEAAAISRAERYPDDEPANEDDVIFFHFLIDGFSAWGKVWERGQEVKVTRGSAQYKETVDRNGNSWLDLVNDPVEQYRRWKQEAIRPGPCPFARREYLEVEDAKRGYRAPVTF